MTGKVRVCFVVAVAENGVIGRAGQLPWRMPTDLKRVRALTLDKPVIMGRKTYESIGKPLERRDNIVISSRPDFAPAALHVVATVEEALTLARTLAARRGVDEIMVLGGAEVFRATLAEADRIYLTLIHGRVEGDTHWIALDDSAWRQTSREWLERGRHDQFPAEFVVLDRRR